MSHQTIINRFLEASKKASYEVYLLLSAPRLDEDFVWNTIGEGGDESLLIDIKAEKIFFKHFESFASIYSEESGSFGHDDYCVILDPIDGSDNLVTNFPYYGASMALQYKGETISGLVCNLVNGDLFYRQLGGKAMKGSLHHEEETLMMKNPHAKVGIFEKSSLHTKIVDKLIRNKLKFRSPGAVALSLVYSLNARFMIFVGSKRTFDIEAGLFISESCYAYHSDTHIILAQEEAILEQVKAIVLEE